jgi:thiol:disulfide interchange protein DsbD
MTLLVLLLFTVCARAAAEPDLLEPDKAFRFSARVLAPDAVEVRYNVAPGYYLYRDKFRFRFEPETAQPGTPDLPRGEKKKDEFFGEVETYRGEVRIRLPVTNAGGADTVTLVATSQGCADAGVCYIPHDQTAKLKLASAGGGSEPGGLFGSVRPERGGAESKGERLSASNDDTAIARLFHGDVLLLVASFFGFGLLLAFTPCVLPMIPILSSIIVGRGAHLTRTHGLALSGAYVLGMAVTYAAAGVLAGLSGAMLSAALQNAWVLGSFAAVFVLLAGAMFGFYELQLPAALQTRLAVASNRLHGGHYAGVFGMGALSALIVGPCVAAPLAAALLYISRSGDVVLGGTALFAMALGMGVPLLAVGASAGALVPKAGPWMETVKRFFGVILLAVAIYLVAPLVPVAVEMLAWAALLVTTGIYLRAIDPLPAAAPTFDRLAKAGGVIALVAGIAFIVGALSGSRDVLQPLAGLRAGAPGNEAAPAASATPFTRVASAAELERSVEAARGKPVMLDFYADWCVSCKEMERYTFSDPQVKKRFAELSKLQADVTANTAEHQALLRRFRLFGPPGIVFFDREGREIEGLRVIGFQPAERFAKVLDEVLAFERVARQ